MPTYKLTSLILVLILVPFLSACRTDGMDIPSGALVTPSIESRLEVNEGTSTPPELLVPTDTSVPPTPVVTELPTSTDIPVPPTPVATESPVPTDTPVPPTPVATEPPVPTDTPVPPTPVVTESPVPTDTPVPPTPVVTLPPPTLLYFWAQW